MLALTNGALSWQPEAGWLQAVPCQISRRAGQRRAVNIDFSGELRNYEKKTRFQILDGSRTKFGKSAQNGLRK